jgi:mannose-6-phosphate isomerase-like protein (cupin superfamily)|tara:strand:- start:4272 stop:4604 length:333 start_codon:yes stop_codon:yes gene_type:complete
MKQVTIKDIGGKVIKDTDVYTLKDNTFGNNLVLSSTFLRAGQSTNGHEHKGQEEVYFFVDGTGDMEIDNNTFNVRAGDVICIEDGEFHRVHNTGHYGLYFVCVFDGGRNH